MHGSAQRLDVGGVPGGMLGGVEGAFGGGGVNPGGSRRWPLLWCLGMKLPKSLSWAVWFVLVSLEEEESKTSLIAAAVRAGLGA